MGDREEEMRCCPCGACGWHWEDYHQRSDCSDDWIMVAAVDSTLQDWSVVLLSFVLSVCNLYPTSLPSDFRNGKKQQARQH
ncbi:unnamed protein product [Calypogeia fissa]